MQLQMNWQDPEYVLPPEDEIVVCQVSGRNGLVKCSYSGGLWLDMNRMPIDVIRWKEQEIHSENQSDEE
ncbi:MAG: hypothetical protein ACLFQG_05150 [Desulfovermiculus sp.]